MPRDDLIDQYLGVIRAGRQDVATHLALQAARNPADVARARRLARLTGVAPAIAEAEPASVQAQARQQSAGSLLDYAPELAPWLSDPDNAALARNDVPRLAEVSNLLRPWTAQERDRYLESIGVGPAGTARFQPPAPRGVATDFRRPSARALDDLAQEGAGEPRPVTWSLRRGARGAASMFGEAGLGIARGAAGLHRMAAEITGDPVAAYADASAEDTLRGWSDAIHPELTAPNVNLPGASFSILGRPIWSMRGGSTDIQESIYSGLTSGTQTLMLAPAGGTLTILGLSGVSSGQAYNRYRDRGGGVAESTGGALAEGVVEGLTERFSLGFLFSRFGRVGASRLITGFVGRELGGEETATFLQDAVNTAVANPNATWADFWADRPQAFLDTAVATLTAAAAIGGAGAIAQRLQPEARAANEIAQGLAGQQLLDSLIEQAQDSEVRTLDPTSFAEFVDSRADGSPVQNVYIPVEAVRAYLQSDGAETDFFEPYAEQLDEAERLNGDLVVPLGEALAGLAGTQAWTALREDVRVSPGGMSGREARERGRVFMQELEDRGAEIAKEAAGEIASPAADVFHQVQQELLAAGRGEREAAAIAQVVAARREAAGTRLGQTAMEYHVANPIVFRQAEKGEKPAAAALKQTDAFRRWFGKSKVVDEKGVPLTMYRGDREAISEYKNQGTGQSGDMLGPGIYLTNNSEYANLFTGEQGQVGSFYVHAENIIDEGELRQQTNETGERLRQWAIRKGYDGIKGNIGDGVWQLVVFKPTQIKSTENRGSFAPTDPRVLFQGKARGQTELYDSSPGAIVTLFADANFSTLIHELGHVFLEEMFRDAQSATAPDELKADVDRIRAWFKKNKAAVTKGVIPVAAHEMFARGFERYAMEGKAPSVELRGAFAQFRNWLLRIYESVRALRAPITTEIREVFDRMLATQEAIDLNQETAKPLFNNAEEAGMTEQEFAAYTGSIQIARNAAYDELLGKTMAALRRRENQKMRDQRSNVRDEVAKEVNARPEFVAIHLLRTGRWLGEPEREATPVKLGIGWLTANYGEGILEQLPRGLPIISASGVDGDVVAEMTGLPSGDALVQALRSIREGTDNLRAEGEKRSVRDLLIDAETDRVMAARHGDTMTDGSIEEEAVAAINSARQGEIIAGEMRQLTKRKAGLGNPTPYRIAREWARRKVLAGRVVDVASRAAVQRYVRATAKAAREAEAAILKGDVDEAFRQKQAQLLNHALLAESKAAADQVDEIVARMRRYAGRKAMASVDQDYFDRVHELLERFDFRPRSQKAVDEQDSFEAWAARRQAEGFEVLTPPRLADQGDHYSRIDVDTLFELNDAVGSIISLGKTKQKLRDAQDERDFNEFRDEVFAHIEQLPQRKLPETVTEDEARIGAGAAAGLLKVETIADELDNHDPNGPMNRLLVQGASKASIEKDELTERTLVPIVKLYNSFPRARQRAMRDKITSDRLIWNTLREGDPRLGGPVTMTRLEWIGVALNTGNLSNLEKMTRGERWPALAVQDELNRHLTKEDWDFVQAVWDNVAALWPDIARVEGEMSGVVPEQVEPLEIDTPFGSYRGGYWPVVFDAARSKRAENNAEDEANDLFGMKSGIGTPKGHTITRTAATGPLTYRVEEILIRHIDKVVTRIAYAQWARDVIRVIDNPKIGGLIDTRLGPEYRRQIKPWLRRQVNSSAVDQRGARWWDRPFRHLRVNLTISAMGFAYSTGVAQLLGLGYSAGRIGPRYVALGLKHMLNPATGFGKAQEFVFSRSPEMQRRGHELNREVVEVFQKLRGKHGWYTNAQAMAFWHIAMVDRYMVAMPTWLGAYRKAIDEGMTDEEAARYGDKIVRNSQGSGREKDLSAIQSPDSETMRFFTMFYTPFNVLFNAQWDAVRAAKSGDWRRSVQLTTWFMIATALADALQSGDWPEDEEGNVGFDDLMSWFGRNVFFGLWGGVPLGRDGATFVERRLIGQYADIETPFSGLIEQGFRSAGQTYRVAFEDEEVTGAYIKSLSRTVGAAVGLPGGQAGKTGGFLWDVSTGEQQPEDFRDWLRGITSGTAPENTR